jgi:hypothetical protein
LSLAIKYETAEDATMRLRNTVVLYRGAPVLITAVQKGENKEEILRVYYQPLPRTPKADMEQERKFISSKHFDIAPFKMGYVNRQSSTGAFFCSRLPNRMQKQGLCAENFRAVDNFGVGINFNTFIAYKEVNEMVLGKYPSVDEAAKALNKSMAVAFSRDFCLVKDEVIPNLYFLYYKGDKVGMYLSNERTVSLGKRFGCLKESLQELGIRVTLVG